LPKPRGLLNHVTVEVAAGQRVCHRHRLGPGARPIQPGETCFVIDTPIMGKQSYCLEAAEEMLRQARADLATLESQALGRARS
jgi:hypothetical protein